MLYDEQILTFSEAAKALPLVNGKRPHVSTLWRWARKGVAGVKLETRRIGGRFVTSVEALDRFTKQLSEIEPNRPRPLKRSRVAKQREREIERAERKLDAAGA